MPAISTKGESAQHPSGDARFELIDKVLKRVRYRGDALIEVLHSAQDIFGFLSKDVLVYVARQLKLPLSRVYGVASFYHLFSFEPLGEHSCTICMGTACYVKGAPDIVKILEDEYDIEMGETTADKQFSLGSARCLGSCGMAPVVVIDGDVVGRETPAATLERIRKVLAAEKE